MWRRRLGLLILSLAVALAATEVGLRVLAHATQRERGVVFDPHVGWRMLPDLTKFGAMWSGREPARTNSDGWRDDEFARPAPAGRRRVVVLGDSFVFGVGVDHGLRFTEVMEELRDDLDVLNLGCNAYGPDQELVVLEREGLALDPDFVVCVVFLGNDLDDIRLERNGHWPKPYFVLEDGDLRRVDPRPGWDVRLRASSYLGEVLFRLVRGGLPAKTRAPEWREADGLPLLTALLARMRRACEERGATFLVVLAHRRERFGVPPDARERAVAAALGEAGIDVLDTQALFRAEDTDELHLAEGHWAPEGHRVIASALVERLPR